MKIQLYKFTRKHIPASYDIICDADVRRLSMLQGEPDYEAHVSYWEKALVDTTQESFLIVCGGVHVGNCGLKYICFDDAELWIYIGKKEFWGQGIGRYACKELLQLAGDKYGLKQVFLFVLNNNIRAIQLYEKLGFVESKKYAQPQVYEHIKNFYVKKMVYYLSPEEFIMDDRKEFNQTVVKEIVNMSKDNDFKTQTKNWILECAKDNYSYHFSWMGLPIIQFPQDIVAMQELIWEVKPDCIIETGVARGGSLIFYAAMMKMMDLTGKVIGVDIDIRPHNRESIEKHPLAKYIDLVQGSSIDENTVAQVKELAKGAQKILVVLDSMHTHDHVRKELELYTPLVKKGSYCVVFDTVIEDMPKGHYADRPWDVGNNPKTAVWEFLQNNDRFEINASIHHKLQITVAPDGYLKCIKD